MQINVWYSSVVGLCDNNNALQNYLDNDSYRDKIMIGYYKYIVDFCNSEIALCTNIFVCFV